MSKKETIKSKIGIFSFFSGAGFLDLGFDTTRGIETLFVNEYHKPFMEIYKSSRKALGIKSPLFGYSNNSVCDFLGESEGLLLNQSIGKARDKYDLIGFIGGPPCPDFSVGGKNKGSEGENGKLSTTYVDLIIKNQPDFFLFENVKGLYRTKKHRAFFDEIKLKLTSSGYCITEKLINAIEYGVPQDRERIILIGFNKKILSSYGIQLNGSSALESFDWSARTIYSTKDIQSIKWPTQDTYIEDSLKPMPDGVDEKLTVQYWFDKNDVENHPNSKHYFKPKAGLVKFQSILEGDDLKKSYKRLHRWRYSPTVAYGNNEVHLHPYKSRRLTVAEALALQSLPKDFVIEESNTLTNMFKTIGNGVPFLAAKGLAETIKLYIDKLINKEFEYEKTVGK